jgi:hypothetical protein
MKLILKRRYYSKTHFIEYIVDNYIGYAKLRCSYSQTETITVGTVVTRGY